MNYRHAYHAGNFGDVLKHAVLALLLVRLAAKAKPFVLIDTHAGVGRYDLAGPEARRTGEAASGALRVWDDPHPALAPWRRVVAALDRDGARRFYPGSPEFARRLCRAGDRIVLAEKHPEDVRALHRLFGGDGRVRVIAGDGYAALKALLPPDPRRGLVLIDPPFEQPGEFGRILRALRLAQRRFATGQVLVWYPVKGRAPVAAFHAALAEAAPGPTLAAELLLAPDDPARLTGCGVVLVNPPWRLDRTLRALVGHLALRLGDGRARATLTALGDRAPAEIP